jgi:hypothetical protein
VPNGTTAFALGDMHDTDSFGVWLGWETVAIFTEGLLFVLHMAGFFISQHMLLVTGCLCLLTRLPSPAGAAGC